jgi:hypothetical protein
MIAPNRRSAAPFRSAANSNPLGCNYAITLNDGEMRFATQGRRFFSEPARFWLIFFTFSANSTWTFWEALS